MVLNGKDWDNQPRSTQRASSRDAHHTERIGSLWPWLIRPISCRKSCRFLTLVRSSAEGAAHAGAAATAQGLAGRTHCPHAAPRGGSGVALTQRLVKGHRSLRGATTDEGSWGRDAHASPYASPPISRRAVPAVASASQARKASTSASGRPTSMVTCSP